MARRLLLETTRSHTHDNQTDGEASDGPVRVGDDLGNRGDDEDGVTEQGGCDRPHDGVKPSEMLIGDVGTDKRHDIRPERVDCALPVRIHCSLLPQAAILTQGQTGRGLLTHAQSSGHAVIVTGTGGGTFRQGTLNKVDD